MNSSQTYSNPWLALSTYEETDSYRFKGRDEDIEKLFNMIQQNELAVCYAASGDGKSSLINAGLCPKLRRVGFFPVKIVFSTSEYNGNNIPLKQDGTYDIDAFLSRKIDESIRTHQSHFEMEKGLKSGEYPIVFKSLPEYRETNSRNALWWKLRTESIEIPFGEFDYRPLLIFDQFEEIFSAKWKSDFFAWLETLMNDTCPRHLIEKDERGQLPSSKQFKVLFSLRYEYVGELDYWSSQQYFIPQMMRNRYFLKPMTREQAVRAIKEQDGVGQMRDKFNSAAEQIVDDIIASESIDGSNPQIPSIVLSVLCFKYYEAWSMDPNASVDALNANNLIYEYYKSVFDDKTIGISPVRRNGLEDILISNSGTRRRMPSSDERLLALNIDKPLLMQLKEKHILRIDSVLDSNGKTEDYVELVHDRVVKAIFECRKAEKEAQAKARKSFRKKMTILVSCIILCVGVFVAMLVVIMMPKSKYVVKKGKKVEKVEVEKETETYNVSKLDTLIFEGNNVIYQNPKSSTRVVKVCGDSVTFWNTSFRNTILEKIIIDVDSAKSINIYDSAFFDCLNLEEIRVDADRVCIEGDAFANCYGLSRVSLHGNGIYIHDGCFYNCSKIRELDVKGDDVELQEIGGHFDRVEIDGSLVGRLPQSDTLIINGSFSLSELPKANDYNWFDVFEIGEKTMIRLDSSDIKRGVRYGTLITHNNSHIRVDSSSNDYAKTVYFDSICLGKFRKVVPEQKKDGSKTNDESANYFQDSFVDYPSMIWVSKADTKNLSFNCLHKKNKKVSFDSAISIKGYHCYGNLLDKAGSDIIAGKARNVILWVPHGYYLEIPSSIEKIIVPTPCRVNLHGIGKSVVLLVPCGYGRYYERMFNNSHVRIKEMGLVKTFWYRMQSLIKPYYLFPFLYPLVTFILIAAYVYWGRLRNPKSLYKYKNRKRALVSVLLFPLIYYFILVFNVMACMCMGIGWHIRLLGCCYQSMVIWFCIDFYFFLNKNVKKKSWKELSRKEKISYVIVLLCTFYLSFIIVELTL